MSAFHNTFLNVPLNCKNLPLPSQKITFSGFFCCRSDFIAPLKRLYWILEMSVTNSFSAGAKTESENLITILMREIFRCAISYFGSYSCIPFKWWTIPIKMFIASLKMQCSNENCKKCNAAQLKLIVNTENSFMWRIFSNTVCYQTLFKSYVYTAQSLCNRSYVFLHSPELSLATICLLLTSKLFTPLNIHLKK